MKKIYRLLDKWLEKDIDVLINLTRQNDRSIKRRSDGELDKQLSVLLIERMNRNKEQIGRRGKATQISYP